MHLSNHKPKHVTMNHNVSKTSGIVRSIVVGALLGIGIALVFAAGFFLRDILGLPQVRAFAQDPEVAGYPLLDEVDAILAENFVGPDVEYTQRQYGAIRGMLSTLNDPYTFFIEPPVAASESDVLAGTYGGVGVVLSRSAEGVFVYPYPESPALAAGIEDGDQLLAINGQPIDLSIPQDAIDQMLRGEVRDNNGAEITVLKPESGETLTVFVPFAVINVPSVIWRVVPQQEAFGYLQVLRFTARTPEELRTAISELNASNIQGLILDLRNNAGGLLQESIVVADEFVDSGVLVYERDRTGETPYDSSTGGAAADIPLVVLVNNGTASGAEIVAGAIQDSGRAILIGQTTYGKGTVQRIFTLSDRSSIHVTASEWFTPDYQPLEGSGLVPDIEMIPDANGFDVELGEALRQLEVLIAAEEAA